MGGVVSTSWCWLAPRPRPATSLTTVLSTQLTNQPTTHITTHMTITPDCSTTGRLRPEDQQRGDNYQLSTRHFRRIHNEVRDTFSGLEARYGNEATFRSLFHLSRLVFFASLLAFSMIIGTFRGPPPAPHLSGCGNMSSRPSCHTDEHKYWKESVW